VRERILQVCLRLFNENGVSQVTTAQIADEVGINEGHLYYYFKKKSHIILELNDGFAQALRAVAEEDLSGETELAPFRRHLEAWFDVLRTFVFFYRDSVPILQLCPELGASGQSTSEDVLRSVRHTLDIMVRRGLMCATPAQRDRLVVNAWILCSHWFGYLHVVQGVVRIEAAHVREGVEQVFSLYAPYLTRHPPAARKRPAGNKPPDGEAPPARAAGRPRTVATRALPSADTRRPE